MKKPHRYICIHCHFYQPPRENPWLRVIEVQDSAAPFHDWNERILSECYSANSLARMADHQGRILSIMNNYEFVSFNIGPTLLSWIEQHSPDTYQRILMADAASASRFSGHGNAIAQVYNHIIMPLASRQDKLNQVSWGIQDFVKRFNRQPEGIWLAETAVDIETLEICADAGIKYTILSPFQAHRIRKKGKSQDWQDVTGGKINPSTSYQITLPSQQKMAIFFYDAPISQAVAFENLLRSSEVFVNRLMDGFSDSRENAAQLVHIATDGESYGHHSKFGDMALASTLQTLRSKKDISLTNYGEFLEKYPPEWEVEIYANTAWSCSHGIERWRSNCGCEGGSQPGWTQEWRKPLRNALDGLKAKCDILFRQKMRDYVADPWQVFQRYYEIQDIAALDVRERFILENATRDLTKREISECLKLLEIARNCMLMYTSCGWFFAEISGIETVQILKYAGRVLQLLQDFGIDYEDAFLATLAKAPSNLQNLKNGKTVYQTYIKTAVVTLKRVCVHYAINSLFTAYSPITRIHDYLIQNLDTRTESLGQTTLSIGQVCIQNITTLEEKRFEYAILHYGDIEFHCAAAEFSSQNVYEIRKQLLFSTYKTSHLTQLIQTLSQEFHQEYYTLKDAFAESNRRIISTVTHDEIDRLSDLLFYNADKNRKLLNFCKQEFIPIPTLFLFSQEFTIQKRLEHLFDNKIDGTKIYESVADLVTQAQSFGLTIRTDQFAAAIMHRLAETSFECFQNPTSLPKFEEMRALIKAVHLLPGQPALWSIENQWFLFIQQQEPRLMKKSDFSASGIPGVLLDIKHLLHIAV